MLLELLTSLSARNRGMALVGLARHPRLLRLLQEARAHEPELQISVFDEYDLALEWCENGTLRTAGVALEKRDEIPLGKHEMLQNLSLEQIELLRGLMERRSYRARDMVVRRGEVANELFLLVLGELSVLADMPDGRQRRLSTLSAGMGFGEPSMVEGSLRSASVRADAPAVCWVLERSAFDSLEHSAPEVKIRVLENLLRSSTQTFGRLSFEAIAQL